MIAQVSRYSMAHKRKQLVTSERTIALRDFGPVHIQSMFVVLTVNPASGVSPLKTRKDVFVIIMKHSSGCQAEWNTFLARSFWPDSLYT